MEPSLNSSPTPPEKFNFGKLPPEEQKAWFEEKARKAREAAKTNEEAAKNVSGKPAQSPQTPQPKIVSIFSPPSEEQDVHVSNVSKPWHMALQEKEDKKEEEAQRDAADASKIVIKHPQSELGKGQTGELAFD